MGLFTRRALAEAQPGTSVVRVPRFAMTRPRASSNLATVSSWPYLGTSRSAALSIPTVANCRDLIVGAAVQMNLFAYRGDQRVDGGKLLEQPDPDTTLAATIGGTVEDLIYEGRAYWIVLARDGVATEANPQGRPVRARWIPIGDVSPRVSNDPGAYSRLEGYDVAGVRNMVAPENMIRFDSPLPGVLAKGADAIANALALEAKARRLADVDIPAGTLTPEPGIELTETEADAAVDRFETARRNHTVAYLQGLVYKREMLDAGDLQLVEARAHAATDMARLHNVPVAMAQASPSGGASAMLYANLGSQLALLVSSAVAPHLTTIEQTLSLPSVTPGGQKVAFDVLGFLRSDPAALQAYVVDLVKNEIVTPEQGARMLGIGPSDLANLQPGTV